MSGIGKAIRPALELAAPHTWPAAVTPVLLGTALAAAQGHPLRPWAALLTLATAVLLQSAVNTLNDRRDFVSGLDSADNCADPTDAALIYSGVTPRRALALGLGFLLLAACCGGALCLARGWPLLWYGLAAAAAIGLYVLPRRAASDLPLGEALSGLAMGGVLPAAAYRVQAGQFVGGRCWLLLPAVLTVGCIMLANNGSDIEKDREGGRRTLPVLLGRARSAGLLKSLLLLAAALAALVILLRFPRGAAALPVLVFALLCSPRVRGLFAGRLEPERRRESMAGVLAAHQWITGVYAAGLILAALG